MFIVYKPFAPQFFPIFPACTSPFQTLQPVALYNDKHNTAIIRLTNANMAILTIPSYYLTRVAKKFRMGSDKLCKRPLCITMKPFN